MDSLQDPCNLEQSGDARRERVLDNGTSSSCSNTGYRLFDRERTIRQIMGGGKAADLILWKQRHVSCGIIIVASVAWLLFERSGLSFLSICSDVFLILIVVQFTRANYAAYHNKQLQPLPELELSEEMVNSAAASFRVKINHMLLMAHDITLGKDFRLFFKVVVCLWLVSVIGGFFSFLTLVYIGIFTLRESRRVWGVRNRYFTLLEDSDARTIVSITIPALYNRYDQHVDRYAGFLHQELSKHYRIVDKNVISRLPRSLSKAKDT